MKYAEDRVDDIAESFDLADEDGDGQISLTEFRGLMLALGSTLRDEAVEASFLRIDSNRDGRIGFEEFRAWCLED
jgi:Ca2+-binding EF-hand superfamily protein